MINLNKHRIAVYFYLLIVLTLIFGLSFAVKGNKITGNAVLETASFVFDNIASFSFMLIIFGFLFSLAFALLVIRHSAEVRKDIKPERAGFFIRIVAALLVIASLSFGYYFVLKEDIPDEMPGLAIANLKFCSYIDELFICAEKTGNVYKLGETIYLHFFVDNLKAIEVDDKLKIGIKEKQEVFDPENKPIIELSKTVVDAEKIVDEEGIYFIPVANTFSTDSADKAGFYTVKIIVEDKFSKEKDEEIAEFKLIK